MPFKRFLKGSSRRVWRYLKGLAGLVPTPWILSFVLFLGVLVVLGVFLYTCRGATHVRLRFAADRLAFTVAGGGARLLDDPLPFETLLIEDFKGLTLDVTKVWIAAADAPAARGADAGSPEPSRGNAGSEDAGSWFDVDGPVLLSPLGKRASLLLRGSGWLARLRAPAGSRVVLEAHGVRPAELTVKVDSGQRIQIAAAGELEVEGKLVVLTGLPGPPIERRTDPLRLIAGQVAGQVHALESGPKGVTLGLITETSGLFTRQPFEVGELELLRLNLTGGTEPSLTRDAELTYPDDPLAPGIVLSAGQYLILEDLQRSDLTLTTIEEDSGGIGATFDGLVGQIRAGTRSFSTDLCVTRWDWLSRNRVVAAIGLVLSWLSGAVGEFIRCLNRKRRKRTLARSYSKR